MRGNFRSLVPLVVVLLLIPPLFFTEAATYISRIFILMALHAILAVALNIVFGHTDQLLLFTGAVTGIGAYTTVLLTQALGISPWLTLLVGALLAGVIGGIVCYVSAIRELSVIVISILTLALQFSIIELINSRRDITGGVTGLTFTGLQLDVIVEMFGVDPNLVLFYLLSILLVAVLVFYQYLTGSKYGLAFEMIRQDEVAAESAGLNVVRYKTIAGFAATFIMGFTGPFFAQLAGYAAPQLFTFNSIDVVILIILIVGGLRTLYGPVVGAALIVGLNQPLQSFGEFRSIFFGALLIFLFLYFRDGIVPFVDSYLEQYDIKQWIVQLGPGS